MKQPYINPIERIPEVDRYSWPEGTSGNPGGRPRKAVTTLLKEKDTQKVANKLYDLAIQGDMSAIREYLDRTEGKVSSELNITGSITLSTPEMMLQAQERLKLAQKETNELLGDGNAPIEEEKQG